MPTMLATRKASPTADVRIVVVSSKAVLLPLFMPAEGLILDEMKTDVSGRHYMKLYGHSKLANIMFARKLSQLYPDIISTSCHPGTVKSEIWGNANGGGWLVNALAAVAVWIEGVTIEEGAKTQLWAATAKVGGKGNVENGHYYLPIGKDTTPAGKFDGDQSMVDELWRWTNEELKAHGGPGWPEA